MCPGGGYAGLSKQNEGTNWAPFFNELGISLFILYYRLPEGDRRFPISEEAIKLIRKNADKWKINPKDVGIMGLLFNPVITMEDSYTKQNFLGEKPIPKLLHDFS